MCTVSRNASRRSKMGVLAYNKNLNNLLAARSLLFIYFWRIDNSKIDGVDDGAAPGSAACWPQFETFLDSFHPSQALVAVAAVTYIIAASLGRPKLFFVSQEQDYTTMVEGAGVRLRGWQQAAVALGSAVGALVDPRRADLIDALEETAGKSAFERVVERMKRHPEGKVPQCIDKLAQAGHKIWVLTGDKMETAYLYADYYV